MSGLSSQIKGKATASSNWLALQKQTGIGKKSSNGDNAHAKKRRKLVHSDQSPPPGRQSSIPISTISSQNVASTSKPTISSKQEPRNVEKKGPEVALLQQMVLGHLELSDSQKLPGRYLAVDCEMVGVGPNGSESSLARVSMVNYHGHVILDAYVKQKEKVTDYRTQWSGIREKDMIKAQPFEEVTKQVAELVKDRILIGHAIHNDFKALLLSHPWNMTRDTQVYAYKFETTKSKRSALRVLVKDELGLTIQSGEHSSVTDARATMAIYRLHKKVWEQGTHIPHKSSHSTGKRKSSEMERDDDDEDEAEADASSRAPPQRSRKPKAKKTKEKREEFPGGGRKGISSGLSTIVHQKGSVLESTHKPSKPPGSGEWWKQLPTAGSKGSIRISGSN